LRLSRFLRLLAALLALAPVALAQQTPDPAEVLQRTGERLLADLHRMPRYTCVQTITRTYYEAKQPSQHHSCSSLIAAHDSRKHKLPEQGWDRLRLEVALVGGISVYSWVGAPRFTDDTLDKLAGHGPLGSGDFGVFISGILLHTTLDFIGERVVDGRHLFEYSYEMPVGKSGYRIKVAGGWTVIGYSGTVLLDPEAKDLVKLVVRTDELPAESTACQATSEVTYARTSIHDRMILVPHDTRLYTIHTTGHETSSQTSYASCREYSSTVKMIFDGKAISSEPVPAKTPDAGSSANEPSAALPAGLRFNAHVITPVDGATAAAGDPIEAVLLSPMHGKKKEVFAPTGAHLHGRLRTVKWWTEPSDNLQITVQFESIEIGGKKVPLSAVLYESQSAMLMALNSRRMMFVHPDDLSIGGTFFFREARVHPKQLDSEWITVAPNEAKDKE
jgi:hypothetical protein